MPRLHPALAVLPPALVAAALIAIYGVNVPFWDQWELVPLLLKQQSGDLTLGDLAAQHNEHRMLFPKLIMTMLASWTGWDIRAELAVNFILASAALTMICRMLRPYLRNLSAVGQGLALLAASSAVFSLAQWENWLWGWQIQWFLTLAAVLASITLLSAALASAPGPWRFGLPVAAATAASVVQFSLASGVTLWGIGLLIIALHPAEGKKSTLTIWMIAAVVSTALFFYGWRSVPIPGMPSPVEVLGDPLRLGLYVLTYVSGPFGRMWLVEAPLGAAGGALLGFTLAGALYLMIRDWSARGETLPWLGLAAFAVACGFITGLGRVGFGIEQATSSRYVTLSSLLALAALGIGAIIAARHAQNRLIVRAAGALAAVFIVLAILGDVKSMEGLQSRHGQLQAGATCLRDVAAASDDCLKSNLYPEASVVRQREPMLRAYGWSGFSP